MRDLDALTISFLEVYEGAIAAHLGVWDVEGSGEASGRGSADAREALEVSTMFLRLARTFVEVLVYFQQSERRPRIRPDVSMLVMPRGREKLGCRGGVARQS